MCVYLGCSGIQILSPVTRSARVHALSATAKDNTHTHTLKMEVRDQSSDGQVGESERYLMDCGRGIGTRKGSLLRSV